MRPLPTAPLAAGSFVAGYAIAVGSGSRTLGGIVLLAGGLPCIAAWSARRGRRTAGALTGVALGVFVASHLLGLAIGAWPAVLLSAAAMGVAAWVYADAPAARRPLPHGPRAAIEVTRTPSGRM
ncbi:MAG TPA: hypothetical protein VMU32_02210 [Solirubrobacteraceae bacterium]|nr:hypothetical protein [Solirubrobacteraceae bacterium]